MAELKNLTVQALRDLARKALGRGHSKLKTKSELIAALQSAERKVAGAAEKAAGKVREATGRVARATERAVETVRGKGREVAGGRGAGKERAGGKPEKRVKEEGHAARAAGAAGKAAREAARSMREVAQAAKAAARRVRAAGGEPEPDPEGHMVARVAGEDAARFAPHPLTESALESSRSARPAGVEPRRGAEAAGEAPAMEEGLGELPWAYGDDALMALPRDPRTLFLYWDHAPDTLRDAWAGLDGGKPQIWVFAQERDGGWTRVRVLDFALESRSYYLHDLDPGRVYRAEIHVVDRQGRDRLLPRGSNPMMLPAVGPSPIIDDRFLRILWSEPLQRLLREAQAGGLFPEDVRAELARLSDWSRFQAQGGSSGGIGGVLGGGMGGRPSSPWMRPSSFSSPSSPGGRSGGEDG
jgi:hypothetical protein